MTQDNSPEALDRARAVAVAKEFWPGLDPSRGDFIQALTLAARYGREGWTPVDPDLLLAREVVAEACRNGDPTPIQIALAAIRAARAEKP